MHVVKEIRTIVLLLSVFVLGCAREKGRFVLLSPDQTGIRFTNTIQADDSVNIFDFPNVYNGGGVGVGDFNNDGLEDLYFTGNRVSNRLYLNKGGFKFQDVTEISGADGGGAWSRGVAVVDINNDGKLDIYVCATAWEQPERRMNRLYVNQGNNADSICQFREMAGEYGLADTTQSTMAYFFDYDNDGDLDLYIGVNHIIVDEYANTFKKRNLNGEHPSTGKLYRNDRDEKSGHAFYTDVSREAGILIEGYTHAVNIADFNNDGWMDIMEANDYASNNVLYINNRDGTFTDHTEDYFRHTAFNSMGSDAVDINNDGLFDIIEVDMLPQDNFRKKMFQSPSSYQTYQNIEYFGFQYQYPRNMLQLNMGPGRDEKDSLIHPVFADVGYYAHIAETDWSWCPLVADFDRDGNKDIVFTNGFPKDITDHDFMTFRKEAMRLTSEEQMLEAIPEVKIHNYAYRNKGELQFEEVSYNWGLGTPSYSNGAVYADLDQDGDLDMIINNINDPAMVYENRIGEGASASSHYLGIKLKGPEQNRNSIGAELIIFQKGQTQYFNQMPYRGYLSTQSLTILAGTGSDKTVDSVIIRWPDHRELKLENVSTDQLLVAEYDKAVNKDAVKTSLPNAWFMDYTRASQTNYQHKQRDFIDFSIQKLLPHKFSSYSPAIAAGDINNDGLDDFVVGSSPGNSDQVFIQKPDGSFTAYPLQPGADMSNKNADNRGVLLFDADNDQDLDLFIAAGGYSYKPGDSSYADHFYLNDGHGNFRESSSSIPFNTASKLCVRSCDFDKDGDLDLFVSGRVMPWEYPRPVSSFLYRNEREHGQVVFKDVTSEYAPALMNLGMGCDALFTDFDNDGWEDLLIAGEWMPLTFLKNEKGFFKNITNQTGVDAQKGWWTSLVAGDFDNDGDMDYIAGNLGLNSFYRASADKPVRIRAHDFDGNGSYDAIPSLYLPATLDENSPWLEYPAYGRDDMIKQIISTRVKYQNYRQYAFTPMDSLVPADKMKGAVFLEANSLASVYVENAGGGRFRFHALPYQAQLAPLAGLVSGDFDNDGYLDVVITGNDYGTEPLMGRYDAMSGLVLKGDGKGGFVAVSGIESGVFLEGDAKGLVKARGAGGTLLLAATQNKGPLRMFRSNTPSRWVSVLPDDAYALLSLANGDTRKQEFYYGSSFLSQSARMLELPASVKSVKLVSVSGKSRALHFEN